MTDIIPPNDNPFNIPRIGTALITGLAFYDANQNGQIEQLSEYGIWNVQPSLYTCPDDILLDTTQTSTQGTFQFDNLEAGEYYIQFEYPSYAILGSVWNNNDGSNLLVDNNSQSGRTNCFTLKEGEQIETHVAFTFYESESPEEELPPSLVVTTSPPTIPFMPIMELPDAINDTNNNNMSSENTNEPSSISIVSDFTPTPTPYLVPELFEDLSCSFCPEGIPNPSLEITIELTCWAIELSALSVQESSQECVEAKRWESRCCPVELLDMDSDVPPRPPMMINDPVSELIEEDSIAELMEGEVVTNSPTTLSTQPSVMTTTPIEKSFDLGLDYEQVGPIQTKGILMNIEGVSGTDSYRKWQTVTANFIQDYFQRNPENVYDVSVSIQMAYETYSDIPIGTYTGNPGKRREMMMRNRQLAASLRIVYNQESTFRSKDPEVYDADYVIEEPFRADYSTYLEKLKASSDKGAYNSASHVITFAVVPTFSPTIAPTPAPEKKSFLEENMMYIYVGASIAGAIITAGILFFVQRRRKRRNGTVVTLASELDFASEQARQSGVGGGGGEVIAAATVVDTAVPNATVVPNSGGGGGAPAVIQVVAPKGYLGVVVDSPPTGGPPYVISVSEDSPMLYKIRLGDKIIQVDGKDVQHLSSTEVSDLLSKKKRKRKRKITLLRQGQGDQGASNVNVNAQGINNPAVANINNPAVDNNSGQQPQANFGVQQPQANYGAQQPPQANFGAQQPQASFGVQQSQANYGVQQPQANYSPQEMSRSFHGHPSNLGYDPQQQMSRSFHGESSSFGYDPQQQMSRSFHGERSNFDYDWQQQMSRSFHGERPNFDYDRQQELSRSFHGGRPYFDYDRQQQMSRSYRSERSNFDYDPQQEMSQSDPNFDYYPQQRMPRSYRGEPSNFRRASDNYDMRRHPYDYDSDQFVHGGRDSYLPHSLSRPEDRRGMSSNYTADSYARERRTIDRRHSLGQATTMRDVPEKEFSPAKISPANSRRHTLDQSATFRVGTEGERKEDRREMPTKYAANSHYNEANITSDDSYGSNHPPENFSPIVASSKRHTFDQSTPLREEPEAGISPEREILRDEVGAGNDSLFHDPDRENGTTVTIIAPAGKLGVTIENSGAGPAFVSEVSNDSVLQGEIELFDRIIELDELDVTEFKAYHISKLLALKSQNSERKIIVLRDAAGTSQSRFVV